MSSINSRAWSSKKRYGISVLFALFVATTAIQIFSPLVAYADPAQVKTKVDSMTLPDQIRSYKMYFSLSVCMNKHAQPASNSKVASGDWFENNQTNTGSLVDKGGDDGNVGCNSILKEAAEVWGLKDQAGFLHDAGWTYYTSKSVCDHHGVGNQCDHYTQKQVACTPTADKTCDGMQPPKNGKDTKFQIAATKLLKGYVPKYPIYFGYYDNFATYTGICGAEYKATRKLTTNDKALGYSQIYVADPATGKVTAEVFTSPNKQIHFGAADGLTSAYGSAVDSTNYTYDNKKVGCADIAKQLSQKNAQQYLTALPAGIKGATPPNSSGKNGSEGDDDDKSTCTVDGIGWIVCPVMNFMAKIVDATYSVVSTMLTTQPLTTDSSIYKPWNSMRNIANIAFVIAFLIIIYSQVTGVGISNYGIKKMLPRVIIAAILVNVSFWICAIAVDLSNIIGASIKDLVANAIPAKDLNFSGSGAASGSGWSGITGTVLAGAAVGIALYMALGMLAPALVAALLSIVTAFLVLTIRQVLIVLLIVIAPLAFVAYLLPNTESWFKRWRQTFQLLLLMYPIIALIFGASSLASKIIMGSADQMAGDNEGMKVVIQIMGALASIIPLALTPFIMKLAGGIAGLSFLANKINNPNKGPFDRLRKRAQETADNSKWARGGRTRKALRNSRKNREFADEFNLGRKISSGEEKLRTKADGSKYSAVEVAQRAKALRSYQAARGIGGAVDSAVSSVTSRAQQSAIPGLQAAGTAAAVAYNATGAGGRSEDISEMGDHFQGEVAKALEEGIRDATRTMNRELSKVDPGDRDKYLMNKAINGTSDIEKAAALNTLAGMGRDGALRQLRDGSSTDPEFAGKKVDSAAINQAVSANVSSLIGKAPDLVKGENAAFGNVSGEQLSSFSKDTGEAYMKHVKSLQDNAASAQADAAANPGDTAKAAEATKAAGALSKAIDSFNSAVEDVSKTPQLQGKFANETGRNIRTGVAALDPATQSRMSGITAIQSDGKIR